MFVVVPMLLVNSFLVLAKDNLDKAYKAYLLGDYNSSLVQIQESMADKDSDEGIYLSGLSYLKLGDYPKARDCFRKIIKRFKYSDYYQASLVKLADAYFLEGNFKRAGALYKDILRKDIAPRFKPLLYLRLAQVNAKEGRWDKEKEYIKVIKENYPYTIENKLAKTLEERGYFFTIQVGAFSSKDNALNLKKELESKYFPVYIVKDAGEGLTLYKVRVGKFKKRKLAEGTYLSLVEEGYPAHIYP